MSSASGSGSQLSGKGSPATRSFRPPDVHPGRLLGRNGLSLLGLVLVVLVQATLLTRIRALGADPNLLLVSTLAWGLLRSTTDGLIWGFAGGIGLDLITGAPLGTSSLAAMTACLLTGIGRNRVFGGNLGWPILLTVLATPVYGWVVLLTQQVRSLPVDWVASTTHVIGPELLLNVATMAVTYPIMRALMARSR
jgi:rod shape-determining protein MreD